MAFECNEQGLSLLPVWRSLTVGCCSSLQGTFCLTPLFPSVRPALAFGKKGCCRRRSWGQLCQVACSAQMWGP